MKILKFRMPDHSLLEIGFGDEQVVPSIGDTFIYKDDVFTVKNRVHTVIASQNQAYGIPIVQSSFEIILKQKSDVTKP